MASYKRKLKDASGNYVIPATRSVCVYMSNNQNLEDYLSSLKSSLQSQIDGTALKLYHVGFVYQSTDATSPASLFGGTWEKIENRFLLGTGTRSAENTGGEETHVLSKAEMPSHNHGKVTLTGNIYGGDTRVLAENAVVTGVFSKFDQGDDTYQIQRASGKGTSVVPDIHLDVSHQHTTEGSGSAHNNMPPYYAVNIWRRTA